MACQRLMPTPRMMTTAMRAQRHSVADHFRRSDEQERRGLACRAMVNALVKCNHLSALQSAQQPSHLRSPNGRETESRRPCREGRVLDKRASTNSRCKDHHREDKVHESASHLGLQPTALRGPWEARKMVIGTQWRRSIRQKSGGTKSFTRWTTTHTANGPTKQTILPPSLICLRRKVPIFIPQAVVNGETKQPRGSLHPMVFDASLQIPLSPIAFKKFTKQRVRMCNIAWSLAKPCMA